MDAFESDWVDNGEAGSVDVFVVAAADVGVIPRTDLLNSAKDILSRF